MRRLKSRSYSCSFPTRSDLNWSKVLRGRAAMQRAWSLLDASWSENAFSLSRNWFLTPAGSPCSLIRTSRRRECSLMKPPPRLASSDCSSKCLTCGQEKHWSPHSAKCVDPRCTLSFRRPAEPYSSGGHLLKKLGPYLMRPTIAVSASRFELVLLRPVDSRNIDRFRLHS